ncbi:hypothetical protein [Streptomyces sp. NPDC001135]
MAPLWSDGSVDPHSNDFWAQSAIQRGEGPTVFRSNTGNKWYWPAPATARCCR